MKTRMLSEFRNPYIWCSIVILIVAGLLRFNGIADKGLFTYDDARLMHFTNTVYESFHNGVPDLQPEFFSSAKPGAIFPFVGAALIFSPQDSLLGIFTAFWGVAVVALTMLITNLMVKNKFATVFAGGVSAISPLQVHYSRAFNVAGSLSMLFALLVFYCYLRYCEKSNKSNAVILGGVMGYAVTINYSLVPYILLFVLFFLIKYLREKNENRVKLRFPCLALLSAPVGFEIAYQLLRIVDGRFVPYFVMLKAHRAAIGMDQQIYFDPFYYFSLLVKYDGVSFALAILGIYFAFKAYKLRGEYIPLILGIVVAVMCIALASGTAFMVSVPRTSYCVIPLLPIMAGVAITSVSRMITGTQVEGMERRNGYLGGAAAVLVCGALFWSWPRVTEVAKLQSGYKQAADWVNNSGGKAGCFVHCMIYKTYSYSFKSLMDKAPGNTINYLVVDFADRILLGKQDFYGWGKYATERALISSLDRSREPLAVFDNSMGLSELMTLESGVGRLGAQTNENPLNGQIRIYSRPD